jgi:hypothetical protein
VRSLFYELLAVEAHIVCSKTSMNKIMLIHYLKSINSRNPSLNLG